MKHQKSHNLYGDKNRRYLGFSSLNGTLVRFSIKIDEFGFDCHKMSLYGIVALY